MPVSACSESDWLLRVVENLSLPAGAGGSIIPTDRFGFAALDLVFLLIGGFILTSAWRQASSEAKGLSSAFAALLE